MSFGWGFFCRWMIRAKWSINKNSKPDVELEFEKWEAAVGKLILACSRVEYELMRLYQKYMPDRNFHSDSYECRFDKSIGVAKECFHNGEQICELLVYMKQAASYRHVIAHNPIHYSPPTGDWHIFDLKSNMTSISLSEITRLSAAVNKISIILVAELRVKI